jgi:iron complex transport system substrate-binding protein
MKKKILIVVGMIMLLSLAGCQNTQKNEDVNFKKVTIQAYNGKAEKIRVSVPYSPKRIAVLDMPSLDIIDNLGMGSRVVGVADTSIDYLKKYVDNKEVKKLGTIKEADLEAVMACQPDVIFIGGRLASSYDALSEIAPVVYLQSDLDKGLVVNVEENSKKIASLFGLADKVASKMETYSERFQELQKIAKGKTAIVGMSTSGSFNLLGNAGRCSIIGKEIGFNNVGADFAKQSESSANSSHGNESSFESVVSLNPNYIFVMDRDSAIGAAGTNIAKEIIENELVKKTDAYKSGNIVYLENPKVWYTAEGGITALDIMLSDLEKFLIENK